MMRLKRDDSGDSLLQNGPRSEYVKKYPEHPVQRTRNYKPDATVVRADAEIDSLTVQRRDYPVHPVKRLERAKPKGGNLKTEGSRDFTSSYQKEYPEYAAEKRKPYKPDTTRPDLGAFEGQASYREHYPEWELPEKRQKGKLQWVPPEQPFGGKSTSTDDFQYHQIPPRVNYKPDNRPLQSDMPFVASTDYADTFKEHPLQQKQPREKQVWTKPTEPFDASTTQQRDFLGVYAPKQKSMRPTHAAVTSDLPLDQDTTSSLSYKPHQLPRRYRHEPETYKQPDGIMDLNTTTGTYYKEHGVQRQAIHKPGSSNLLKGSGEMQTDTNYYKDFKQYPVERRELMKPKNDYVPPIDPVESITINQAAYQPHKLGPRANFKPANAPLMSDQPFVDSTGYNETFKAHKITPRQKRTKETYAGPTAPLDAKTTAGESYLGPYQPKRESFRPDQNPIKSEIPFDDNTTMTHDFKAYDVKKREMRKPNAYHKPEGDMNLSTTHNVNYKEPPLQRVTVHRPESSHLLQGFGEMSSTTNYQGDFVERPIQRRALMKPEVDYQAPVNPMETRTTHQAAFFEREINRRENFRPKTDPMKSDEPFADRTENRDTFVPYKISPRERRQKENRKPPSAPLDDRTTARDSYKGPTQAKRESFKPDTNQIQSDVPFDGCTTMNSAFKEVQLPERYVHKPADYTKPEGQMDLTTTHIANYKEPQHPQRPTINKPGSSNLLKGSGEMSKTSNYNSHFQKPLPTKRELRKRPDEYYPPTAPLDSTTTNSMSYKEPGLSPRTNFKPKGDYMKSDQPFDDRTDYRDRFTQHQLPPRHVIEKEDHKPPSAPFDSRTTANESYLGPFQPKRESFRPNRDAMKSDEPFQADTTFGSAFKAWPTMERYKHRPGEYIKPEGNMDLTTINKETYKDVQGVRPTIRRQGDSNLLSYQGKFQDKTSYGNEFVPKSLEHRKLVKAENDYTPSTIPFENRTTYQSSHVGYVAPRERGNRPDMGSDVLGQRDINNPFHIRDGNWKGLLAGPQTETVSA